VAMVPVTIMFVKEHKTVGFQFSAYALQFWELIQKRATWQVMLFNFFFNLFSAYITSTAAPYVKYTWANVGSLNNSLAIIFTNLIFAGVLVATGKWGTHWNWRHVVVITTLGANIIDSIVQYCVIYDVYRSQWFYLGVPLAEQLPYGVQFIVTTFVIVELAEDGNEGIMYGLLTTVSNLPGSFGPPLANIICRNFDVKSEDILTDTPYVRNQVAYTYLIYYATTVIACCFVFLLPKQKEHVQELKNHGGKYPIVGGSIIIMSFFVLVFSITTSLMSMYESTSCYIIAGGSGCSS